MEINEDAKVVMGPDSPPALKLFHSKPLLLLSAAVCGEPKMAVKQFRFKKKGIM